MFAVLLPVVEGILKGEFMKEELENVGCSRRVEFRIVDAVWYMYT